MITLKQILNESCSDSCENIKNKIQNFLDKEYPGLTVKEWEKRSGKTFSVLRVDGKMSEEDRKKITNLIYKELKHYFPNVYKKKTNYSTTVETIFIPKTGEHQELRIVVKGSSKGSGLGSEETRIYENYIAKLLNRAWAQKSEIKTLDDVPEEFKNDTKWKQNFKSIVNTIFSKFHNKFKNLEFSTHEKNPVVKAICEKYRKINKEEKFFTDINKWNPADVWGVDKKLDVSKVKKDLKSISSFYDLKRYIQMLIDKGLILPISLKNLNDSSKPKVEFVNFEKIGKGYSHVGFTFEQRSPKITDSKDVVIRGVKGSDISLIKFRTFNKMQSFQAEIEGKEAKYGKIGGGVIFKIIEDLTHKRNLVKDYNKLLDDIRKADEKDLPKYAKILHQLAQKVSKKVKGLRDYSEETISKRMNDRDWLLSKILAFKIVNEVPTKRMNEFVNKLLDYALSQSEYSAPHIKIY